MEEEEPILPPVCLQQAPDDKDVRRQELFCSKIIHQRSGQQQMRFRHHAPYIKIVLHGHPNCTGPGARGEYPRPISSPFPCFACHRMFSGPPVFLPMTALDGTREEWGNFCCAPCVNRYLHSNLNDSNLAARAADMLEYMQDVHGFRGAEIGMAPHFSERQAYGGDLTDEQFDAIVGNPALTTTLRMFPFIPTPSVVEWCFTGTAPLTLPPLPGVGPAATASAATAALRSQPLQQQQQQQGQGGTGGPTPIVVSASGVPASTPAGHHHEWEVRNLVQPPLATIEQRLATLPPLEQRTGLYELYLQRKGGLDGPVSDDEEPPAPKSRPRQSRAGGAGNGATAARKRGANAIAAAAAAAVAATAPGIPAVTAASGEPLATASASEGAGNSSTVQSKPKAAPRKRKTATAAPAPVPAPAPAPEEMAAAAQVSVPEAATDAALQPPKAKRVRVRK